MRMVEITHSPGVSVSEVTRRNGFSPSQLFQWRKLTGEGGPSTVGAGEEVVSASDYRALQQQVRELQRLLGKKTLEVVHKITVVALAALECRRFDVKAVAETLGVSRSKLIE
jgi:transposase-like protein